MARSSIGVAIYFVSDASDRCIGASLYGPRDPVATTVWDRSPVRWVRRGLVVLLLAAPVLAVAAVAWPDGGGGGGGNLRREGSGPDGALAAGDRIGGELGFGEVAGYEATGTGERLRIGVTGVGFDFTLTVVGEDGDQLAYNDDTNGLDPEVTIALAEGETATVEVRELGGRAAGFTMSVERAGGDDDAEDDEDDAGDDAEEGVDTATTIAAG
jgi:hypothetical protein